MKTPLRVKICGIKTLPDALAAVEAGADLLGFNFYPPSPRCLSLAECQAICQGLRQSLGQAALPVLVGVFVNPTAAQVTETLAHCGLDLAQLCGDEDPALLHSLGGRAFKALRPVGTAEPGTPAPDLFAARRLAGLAD